MCRSQNPVDGSTHGSGFLNGVSPLLFICCSPGETDIPWSVRTGRERFPFHNFLLLIYLIIYYISFNKSLFKLYTSHNFLTLPSPTRRRLPSTWRLPSIVAVRYPPTGAPFLRTTRPCIWKLPSRPGPGIRRPGAFRDHGNLARATWAHPGHARRRNRTRRRHFTRSLPRRALARVWRGT